MRNWIKVERYSGRCPGEEVDDAGLEWGWRWTWSEKKTWWREIVEPWCEISTLVCCQFVCVSFSLMLQQSIWLLATINRTSTVTSTPPRTHRIDVKLIEKQKTVFVVICPREVSKWKTIMPGVEGVTRQRRAKSVKTTRQAKSVSLFVVV